MYVALVPQSSRFRRLVRSWKYASEKQEHTKRLEEMYKNLPPEMRSRYAFVQQVAQAIRTNYQQLSASSQVFARQMAERLDGLLEGYVRLLFTANTHREYLKSLNPDQVRSEVAFLEKSLEKNAPKVQEINRRRIEILRKRVTKFEKIQENRQVIDAQCAAIEDVLQLIRDQSVTMRDPQEVSAQLENLVQDVEQTEQSVREMEEIYALTAQENDELRLPEAGGEPPQQNRVRN
jgi:chromosome segregation ATPase